jgi:16S rRNA (uracil1498-N3)-methyltransferase
MHRRFFVSQLLEAPALTITGSQAHHLRDVLRTEVGSLVTLFDGSGREATASVTRVAGDAVELAIVERRTVAAARPSVTLATAVPKGTRFTWLVEKATELGVDRLVPLVTRRSVVDPGTGKLDKLRRTIVEASKQCGRARLMELTAPVAWSDFVERELAGMRAWIADPSGEPLEQSAFSSDAPAVIAIGPEGGWTEDELDQARGAGGRVISLGPNVLRIETAALVAAALLLTSPYSRSV